MITIKHDHLRAVSLFQAKADIRYYLNGVLVEVLPRAVRLVATDGHVLALTHTPIADDEPDMAPYSLIIPLDTVDAIAKVRSPLDTIILTSADGKYSLCYGSAVQNFDPVDATFPDYRRVIPDTYDGTTAQFNPNYLALFQRAAQVYNRKALSVTIAYNGLRAALIGSVHNEFLGVIMPVPNAPPTLPPWFAEQPKLAAAA